MTKVAIIGATGPTGIHLAVELRKTVVAVRAIARGTDKLERLFPDAAIEKRSADILDADATLRATDGCVSLRLHRPAWSYGAAGTTINAASRTHSTRASDEGYPQIKIA
jgi:uncharacterized protein YbjT (DUF2867 family)